MNKLLLALLVGVSACLSSSSLYAEEHMWTNKQGNTVRGVFISATSQTVTISVEGKTFVVNLSGLSRQSQSLAQKLETARLDKLAKEKSNKQKDLLRQATERQRDLDRMKALDIKISQYLKLAIDYKRTKSKEGKSFSEDNPFTPFTGWIKHMNFNKVSELDQYKDGLQNGLSVRWNLETGKKLQVSTYKDNKMDGLSVSWYDSGQKSSEIYFKKTNVKNEMSLMMSATVWKPNGQKCSRTNLVNGNGNRIYYDDYSGFGATGNLTFTYKNGVLVKRNGVPVGR